MRDFAAADFLTASASPGGGRSYRLPPRRQFFPRDEAAAANCRRLSRFGDPDEVTRPDPDRIAHMALSGQIAAAREVISARLRGGVMPQNVILRELTPAARRLSDFWLEDTCDFFELSHAMGALGELLREIAPPASVESSLAPSILVSTAPDEAHRFGADVLAAVFQLAGWRALRCNPAELVAALKAEIVHVAAFSLTCAKNSDKLSALIGQARCATRRSPVILVGGPAFASQPWLADRIGADFCATESDLDVNLPRTIFDRVLL